MMRRALEYARGFDLPVIDHCEDKSLARGGVMHEGHWSLVLGLRGMPAAAEEVDADRDVALAQLTGAHIHLAHLSTRGAIAAARRAKAEGWRVSCEVAPHHWALTDAAVEDYDTNTKMSPPLRSQEHVDAILEGLRDGTIDAIASDHAPHHADEKDLEFDQAPFGIIGLETTIGLAFEKLVRPGVISLDRLVELCATNPARLLSLHDRGTFKAGARGDVTILDPEMNWTYELAQTKSKSRNTPFDGYKFTGAVIATIVGGRVVHSRCAQTLHKQTADLRTAAI